VKIQSPYNSESGDRVMISYQMFKRLQRIAKSGSMTKAADALFISRPALVQQVKAAETKLGFAVFERSAKGVTLTPVGKVFMEEGAPIIHDYEQLYQKCLGLKNQKPKTVIIGTLPEIYSPLLFNVCRKYKTEYPDADIHFKQETAQDYFPAFFAGDFDVTSDYMFNFAQGFVETPATGVVLCKPGQLNICVPKSNPLASLEMATFEDLRGSKLMLHTRGLSKADDILRDYLETHEPSIQLIDFSYYGHELFVRAEIENALLVCVRQYSFNLPNFSHVSVDWDFPVERGIMYRKNCRPAVKEFINLIKQSIAENDL